MEWVKKMIMKKKEGQMNDIKDGNVNNGEIGNGEMKNVEIRVDENSSEVKEILGDTEEESREKDSDDGHEEHHKKEVHHEVKNIQVEGEAKPYQLETYAETHFRKRKKSIFSAKPIPLREVLQWQKKKYTNRS